MEKAIVRAYFELRVIKSVIGIIYDKTKQEGFWTFLKLVLPLVQYPAGDGKLKRGNYYTYLRDMYYREMKRKGHL
jgi:hypothetical protein